MQFLGTVSPVFPTSQKKSCKYFHNQERRGKLKISTLTKSCYKSQPWRNDYVPKYCHLVAKTPIKTNTVFKFKKGKFEEK